jgi:hypothetical protein
MSENAMIGKWIRYGDDETNKPLQIVGFLPDGESSEEGLKAMVGDSYIVKNDSIPEVSPRELRGRPFALVPGIGEPLGPNPFLVGVKSVEEDWVMCDAEEQP